MPAPSGHLRDVGRFRPPGENQVILLTCDRASASGRGPWRAEAQFPAPLKGRVLPPLRAVVPLGAARVGAAAPLLCRTFVTVLSPAARGG